MSSRRESDFARLEKRLKEAEERAEEERRRAEEERRRAEEERRRAEGANRRNQQTTFEEFLKACHEHLHKAISVETDTRWTTKGFTNPKNKFYPKTLSPWQDFLGTQQRLFEEASTCMHPPHQTDPHLFSPVIHFEELGRKLRLKKLASEQGLAKYEQTALEDNVADIIHHLCQVKLAKQQFQLGQGIVFEDHINSLSDVADEVQQHLLIQTPIRTSTRNSSPSPSGSDCESKPTQTRADQFCVYKSVDGMRALLFIVEYKPPHKLSIGNLQAGFRPMNIKEIFTAATIPTAEEARLQYNADKLVAAVATQTFHYMIENGLEYSYITTGEVFVFLHIKEDDPTTLYYHVSVPSEEIGDMDLEVLLPQTAVSQVMGLCLMAFQSEQRSHRWRSKAKKGLEKYRVDYEAILQQIPETERKRSPLVGSVYKGRKPLVDKESPYHTRLEAKKAQARANANAGCNSNDERTFRDDEYEDPDTPSRPEFGGSRNNQSKGKGKDQTDEAKNSVSIEATRGVGRQRQYCTQECLLGIVRGLPLDERCPNASLHHRHGNRHAIDLQEFRALVRNQLAKDLDHDCEPLGLQGARGALFRITLAAHGYVFVGKGTVRAFVPTIVHEGRVYQQLEDLYGTAVPVCLGNINLVRRYYLDVGVRISHMLLMSWGGEMVTENIHSDEIRRTVREVRSKGIEQGDTRAANILWNEERKRAMLIDFERATYIDGDKTKPHVAKDKRALQEVSPNKKRKRIERARTQDK